MLIPRSTAKIFCLDNGVLFKIALFSNANRRNHFLCFFSNIGTEIFALMLCFLILCISVCFKRSFTHCQAIVLLQSSMHLSVYSILIIQTYKTGMTKAAKVIVLHCRFMPINIQSFIKATCISGLIQKMLYCSSFL